jgi:hypothetical protein
MCIFKNEIYSSECRRYFEVNEDIYYILYVRVSAQAQHTENIKFSLSRVSLCSTFIEFPTKTLIRVL